MKRCAVLLAGLLVLAFPASARQEGPRVRSVLFFSPTCPHCHEVITNGLPPIVERFGDSLVIVVINVQTLEGQRLFQAAGRRYGIPADQLGVPLLAVADRALVGSFDIPDQLPGIVERGLADGGIDWPDIEGLHEALLAAGVEEAAEPRVAGGVTPAAGEEAEATPEEVLRESADSALLAEERVAGEPARRAVGAPEVDAPEVAEEPVRTPEMIAAETTLASPPSGLRDAVLDLAGAESTSARVSPGQRFAQDPKGNSIAVVVLLGMLASLTMVLTAAFRRTRLPVWPGALVATLILLGFVVAGYLSWVELTYSEAVCGPVGDCNAVQQSPYARLFGLIPVGILGVYAYAALGLGWLLLNRAPARWNGVLATGLWLVALVGTVFSIYLTALEPFVIGATCMWCVTSAVIITLLMWAATPAAVEAWDDG